MDVGSDASTSYIQYGAAGLSWERLFRNNEQGSIRLHSTWDQSVNIQGRGREQACQSKQSLTLALHHPVEIFSFTLLIGKDVWMIT